LEKGFTVLLNPDWWRQPPVLSLGRRRDTHHMEIPVAWPNGSTRDGHTPGWVPGAERPLAPAAWTAPYLEGGASGGRRPGMPDGVPHVSATSVAGRLHALVDGFA